MDKSIDYFEDDIKDIIFIIRGQKVLLDFHIAALFKVETKALKQAVKRNLDRFPEDFMFVLTPEEWETTKPNVIGSKRGGTRYMPMVFTEQGVAMLASVLRSNEAVQMSIMIIRAFVKLRRMVLGNQEFSRQLHDMEQRYDAKMKAIYDALDRLIVQRKEDRKKIGFKQKEKKPA